MHRGQIKVDGQVKQYFHLRDFCLCPAAALIDYLNQTMTFS